MERTTHRIAWQRLCRRFGAFLLRKVGVREVGVLLLRKVGAEGDGVRVPPRGHNFADELGKVASPGMESLGFLRIRSRGGVRVPPRGPDRIFSLSSKGKYLSCPLVGASKFLILIMNFEDAQFVAPPH